MLDGKAVILNVRNRYEQAIGMFNGAFLPPIRPFSDFPKFVRENKHLFQDRRALMYCTGGICCERASALVKEMGVTSSVAKLRGGVYRFLSTYPDGVRAWGGKNLLFDARMAVPIVEFLVAEMLSPLPDEQQLSLTLLFRYPEVRPSKPHAAEQRPPLQHQKTMQRMLRHRIQLAANFLLEFYLIFSSERT